MDAYFERGGWRVTASLIRSPRRTFAIDKVEAVSLRRTLFLVCLIPAAGAILIAALFWHYLFFHEIVFLLGVSGLALAISYQFGALTIETLALRDQEGGIVFGRFALLADARDAIEHALDDHRRLKAEGEK